MEKCKERLMLETLYEALQQFYSDPKNQKAFEQRKEKTNGANQN